MNKNFLWTFITTLLLTACGSEYETSSTDNPEVKISLVAPNGERISADMPSLNCEVATMVAKQFGNDYPFTITDIQYTDIEDGYLALIEYQLENGQKSNYAITNSKNILSEHNLDYLNIDLNDANLETSPDGSCYLLNSKSDTRSVDEGKISFVCKSASNCTPCQVKILTTSTTIDTDINASHTEKTKISCSSQCTDCKLEATIY